MPGKVLAQMTIDRLALLDVGDLPAINGVIVDAIQAWPVGDRLKRCSAAVLSYQTPDFAEFEFLGLMANGCLKGVAVWGEVGCHDGPHDVMGGILHGLYVAATHQRMGYGRLLIRWSALHARAAGVAGLLVKSQRVSVDYFRGLGLEALTGERGAYPYSFWLDCTTMRTRAIAP